MENFTLPPALLYGLGVVLIVFGGLRAVFLGLKQRPKSPEEAEEAGTGWGRAGGGGYKRHLTFGVLWVVMGVFLVITTVIKSR